jgi:hypothetical protein
VAFLVVLIALSDIQFDITDAIVALTVTIVTYAGENRSETRLVWAQDDLYPSVTTLFMRLEAEPELNLLKCVFHIHSK